jgi:hypothetical protein
MEVIGTSLTQAKENGLLKYATGKPCKRGHIGERYASTGQCVSCIAKQSADWYRANPEVGRRKAKRQYWMNPTKHQAAAKAWREANPERSAELTASWHARNPGGRVLHEMARRPERKVRAEAIQLPRSLIWPNAKTISVCIASAQSPRFGI